MDGFLDSVFSKPQAEFLRDHGRWWHKGDHNRFMVLVDEEPAAYCGIIPTECYVGGKRESAFWWVDLVVAPQYRGRGLQSIIDREIRSRPETKLGFPNELAIGLHQKHGWGVRRDLRVLMLPLRPMKVKKVLVAPRLRGFPLRVCALAMTPLANRVRRKLQKHSSQGSGPVENPSSEAFENVFLRTQRKDTATTYRSAEFVQWRYLDAPYRSQLSFYFQGDPSEPTHFLVARHIPFRDTILTRILDVFGDFGDLDGLTDILKTAIRDAIGVGSSQVTVMAADPEPYSLLRGLGFLISTESRFCWWGASSEVNASLGGRCHWALGDSDNDEPV